MKWMDIWKHVSVLEATEKSTSSNVRDICCRVTVYATPLFLLLKSSDFQGLQSFTNIAKGSIT